MKQRCILTLSLLAPEQKNTIIAYLINNGIEILMPDSGDYNNEGCSDTTINVSYVCCLFLVLPDNKELDYVSNIIKNIDISHFGGSVTKGDDALSFEIISSNIKRSNNF